MIENVIFVPEADEDVAVSYLWYETHEPGLGEDFLRCVEGGIEAIRRHPEFHPIAAEGFRRSMIRRFPFEIIFEATGDNLHIYAVFHSSRNPDVWRKRLKPGKGTD